MSGPLEDRLDRSHFHDPTQVHDRDRVADILHHREIVADEDVRQIPLPLQADHQIQHLTLHRHVQRGDRFVRDDELGFES